MKYRVKSFCGEGQDVDRRWRSTFVKDTMSAGEARMELRVFDIGGDDELLPGQGGAEDTEERV